MHTIVIGGGIAGLALAWQLARRGSRRVTLLEREAFLGTHSSARNAQIWLPADDDETTGPLAERTVALMTDLLGSERAWLARGSAVVVAPDEEGARSVERGAARGKMRARRAMRAEVGAASPMLCTADAPVLIVDGAGILDPHAMVGALAAACRKEGVSIVPGANAHILAEERVRGVVLASGETIIADEVVIAAGAWSRELGAGAGVDVPLVPLRRHLVLLEGDPARAGTTVWRFGASQVYYRPDSGGVLASPCDEDPFEPCLPPADDRALDRLARELETLAPELVDAPVRTRWACLRTYAHDRELVLGPDPRLPGLAWMAGFGGRGMTVAVGAAELAARALDGEHDALLALMRPERSQPSSLAA